MQPQRSVGHRMVLAAWFLLIAVSCGSVRATDFFLTIGGGYRPEGIRPRWKLTSCSISESSKTRIPGPRVHDLFFADGDDPVKDLQIEAPAPKRPTKPLTELLTTLHRRGPPVGRGSWYAYRNHEVPNVAGPNDPKLVQKALDRIADTARKGDRLIVYVTAHGDEAEEDDPYNTSITAGNDTEIRMHELTEWLDKLSPDVPVVMVMAQCYCGGFSQTIYRDADPEQGLAPAVRVGFFAQQHNLPASGCRPDIENDAEYSSYFWGAMVGQTRNGKAMPGCDADGNGVVSFEEAHAQAIIAAETIDRPAESLRHAAAAVQRDPRLHLGRRPARQFSENGDSASSPDEEKPAVDPKLNRMQGTIESLLVGEIALRQTHRDGAV